MTTVDLLVVGGGPGGLEAARGFRETGAGGDVLVVSVDDHPPYRRPPLSKEYLRGDSDEGELPLEGAEFYRDHEIALRLGTEVVAIDPTGKLAVLAGGETVAYRVCVLATGSTPAKPPIGGADDPAVHYLRSRADAARLRDAASRAETAVVVGSGFIGCEAAASLARRGLAVTLVTHESLPQAARLGEAAAGRIGEWLSGDGVTLRSGVEVAGIESGRTLALADGTAVRGDLVLVATGVVPAAELASEAGLAVREGRVVVDDAMRSSEPGVLAAGDVALAYNAAAGRHLVVEHWGEALAMGRVAGETAAGRRGSWSSAPGFWTTVGDRTLKYAAWGDGFDEVRLVEHGGGAFTIWYGSDGITVGVLTHQADDDYERGRELVETAAELPV